MNIPLLKLFNVLHGIILIFAIVNVFQLIGEGMTEENEKAFFCFIIITALIMTAELILVH